VLHVTPYSADAWAYGGIPRVADALARGLARRGHDVTVCTTDVCDRSHRLDPGRGRPRFEPWPDTRTPDGVTLRVFPNLSNRLAYDWQLFMPVGLGAFLRRSAGAFDVAHLHACRNLPGAIAAHHLRRAGVPYVLAPNGTAPRIERRRVAKRVFDVALGARIVREASRLIAVSEAERSQFDALGVRPDAIRLVPNPLDLAEFTQQPARGQFRKALATLTPVAPGFSSAEALAKAVGPAIGSAPLVLFLGRLSPRKRLDVLVGAFSRVRRSDARLVVAGNDMGAADEARAFAESSGISDRTTFTGLLRGRERLDALADADVVVYPSQDEIFGLVPLEALLCGTPVIVADDSGCAEVVRGVGGGKTVPVGDADALARAIDDVLDDPARWRGFAAEAALRVRAAFAADAVCERLDDVYREVVNA
jgi:glycosyltransferase involved in cell wall biosynthesis